MGCENCKMLDLIGKKPYICNSCGCDCSFCESNEDESVCGLCFEKNSPR